MSATSGTPRAKALAAALRQARETSKLGVREVARAMGIQHSTVSYWESGKRVPRIEDVSAYLQVLGVNNDERERILDLTRGVFEPNWLTAGVAGVSQGLAGVLECERTASHIVEWSPLVVPGLLQTSDYARAIMSGGEVAPADVEARVMLRAGRRDILMRAEPAQLDALIGEPALRSRVGGQDVHLAQLRHLLRVAEQWASVTLQVVRTDVDWHPGMAGPFALYRFEDSPPIVHLEHHRSSGFLYDETDLVEYAKAADRLREEVAMSVQASVALIADVIKELE